MNIVFCADRSVLPGLHVAAFSVLKYASPKITEIRYFIFSDSLSDTDLNLLHKTLASLQKPFSLELRRIEASLFNNIFTDS